MTADPSSSVSSLSDFPDWVGPMWVKELRQGLRRNLFLINFLLLHFTMCSWVVFMALGDEDFVNEAGEPFFWVILVLGLLMIPGRALWMISSEKKAHTFELIQLSSLSPWQIVFGKWSALVSQALLLTVSLLPYACIRYFFGKLHLVNDSLAIAVMMGVAAILTACGIMISTLNKYGVILSILACVIVAPFILPFFFMGLIGFIRYFQIDYAVMGVVLIPFYAVLYSLMILNFATIAISRQVENNSSRMKILGWLALLPALLSVFIGGGGWELPIILAGTGVLGVIVVIFYSLSAPTLPSYQAEAAFRRYGFWGRKAALFLAPSNESGARNSISLALLLVVSFLLPFWISWTELPSPIAASWFFICFFAGVLLPWIPIHFMGQWSISQRSPELWFIMEIFLTVYTMGLVAVFMGMETRWLSVAVSTSPFGSLFLTAVKKEILPESVVFIILQWVSIMLVMWLRRPPKIETATLGQQEGVV
ncbi:MAG: hypothetical protein LBV12_11390 [Puniceicoccales bacterium]|jgi:hypothetical protein|nr:hypothetical protein [Puniceicoccales bacterium]